MTKKKLLKLLAGLAGLGLIVLLLTMAFAFVGNPVTAAIATWQIRSYVDETYPQLQLEVPWATYNFKFGEYMTYLESPTSPDTAFTVSWKRGAIYDRYETEVTGRFNTYRRLQQELDAQIEALLARDYPYETTLVLADFQDEGDLSTLTLDMELDIHQPPLPIRLTLWIVEEEPSYERLAQCLTELDQLMQARNIPVLSYSVNLEKPRMEDGTPQDGTIYLSDYPADQIGAENLPQVLEAYQKERSKEMEKEKEVY